MLYYDFVEVWFQDEISIVKKLGDTDGLSSLFRTNEYFEDTVIDSLEYVSEIKSWVCNTEKELPLPVVNIEIYSNKDTFSQRNYECL